MFVPIFSYEPGQPKSARHNKAVSAPSESSVDSPHAVSGLTETVPYYDISFFVHYSLCRSHLNTVQICPPV